MQTVSDRLPITRNRLTTPRALIHQKHTVLRTCRDQLMIPRGLNIVRISVNVTAHFANNVTGASTRLRGV